jgi:hypothetical protein
MPRPRAGEHQTPDGVPFFLPGSTPQNLRGGRVKLQSIMMPEMEFSNADKGGCCIARDAVAHVEVHSAACHGRRQGSARTGGVLALMVLDFAAAGLPLSIPVPCRPT